jgi:aminopeptidase N
MLALYIGENNFRDGLRHYLKKHSYKNTNTSDLWNSFEKVSGVKVKQMMNVWTKIVGYPLVTLSKGKDNYKFSQERFFLSRISRKKSLSKNSKTIWSMPLKYASDKKITNTLIRSRASIVEGSVVGKVNMDEGSFVRVLYDKETLNLLRGKIGKHELKVVDRLGIIRDLFALAEGGYISAVEALEFAMSYKNESEYIVWSEIAGGINKIHNIIVNESLSIKNKYKLYTLELFSPLANRMGWEKRKGEKNEDTFLRSLAISQAGFYGDINIIVKAKKIFNEKNTKSISPDIRSAVYSIVAQNGSKKEWDQFKKLYSTEKLHEEKERFGRALSQFKDKKLLKDTLDFALSKDVRSQDAPSLIGGVWSNPIGRDLSWSFVKNKWPEIVKRYGEGGHFLSRLLSPLGNHNKKVDAEDAKKFFKKNKAPGADRTLLQVYERIYSNDAWQRNDKEGISSWLKNNFK